MNNKKRGCKRAAAMLLAALLVVNSVDLPAFTAYAAQAELVPEKKEQSELSKEGVMTITGFGELEEGVMQQLLPVGASQEEIVFPNTLNVTAAATGEKGTNEGEEATQTKKVALTGVTWEIDPSESDGEVFDSCEDCDGYCYVYTPVLPETDEDGNKVTLGEGVEAPVIYVLIGEGEDHVSAIAVEGYTEEGFCEGYKWVNGNIEKNGDGETQCSHGDDCNGYQPAEEKSYDVNGDGTIAEGEKAYEITNAGQLYWFAAYVNEGGDKLNANAYLANDITVNEDLLNQITTDETTGEIANDGDFRKWVPIGDYATKRYYYKGVFDGDERSIGGIYINEADKGYRGLFGGLEGSVLSLEITDSMICGLNYNGGIAGTNKGNVEKCIFRGRVISEYTENNKSGNRAGGIVGFNDIQGKIEKCINYGSVTGYRSFIGGIVGDNIGNVTGCVNEGDILNCYPTAVYDTEQAGAVGGIVGCCAYYYNSQGNVTNCVNHGKVEGKIASDGSGKSAITGGIVGLNDGGKIDSCWNDGEIKGNYAGGICGNNGNFTSAGEILNSYNIGVIESGYGICYYTNYSDGSNVKNCYTSSSKVAYFNEDDNGIEAGYTNVYYLSMDNNGKAVETDNSSGTTAMTAADFASGKVAYLLNQGQESAIWYQNIDSGTADSYPVLDLTHGTVYPCTPCTGVYSNTSGTAAEHVLIQNVNDTTKHICKNCGESNMAHSASSFTGNGNKITGTCVCEAECGTFTLNAPASLTYDGTAKEASVSGEITGVTETPTISYFKVENGTETPLTGKPTEVGEYKASISCGSGENTATVSVTYTIAQATPSIATAPTVNITYNPKTTLLNIDLKGESLSGVTAGTVNDIDENPLVGSWSWKTPDQVPLVNNSGYEATFTPNNKNYKSVDRTITVTVAKATPYIAVDMLTVAKITYGQTLADARVQGSVFYSNMIFTPVAGTFVWKDGNTKPKVSDSGTKKYTLIFHPTDSINYDQAVTEITITVNKAQNAPDMPDSTMSVAHSCKTVGDVILPEHWKWQDEDKTKTLTAGESTTATAVYEGADKGNYVDESRSITITVSKAAPTVATAPTVNMTYDPNKKLSDFNLNTAGTSVTAGTVKDADQNTLSGTWSWKTPDQVPQGNNSGYKAVFTPDDTTNYEPVTHTITVTVAKAAPCIKTAPAAAEITCGETLASSALTGGLVQYSESDTTAVAGSFVWKNGNTKPQVSDSGTTKYTVIFQPADSVNYNEVETEIIITVNKAQSAGSSGSSGGSGIVLPGQSPTPDPSPTPAPGDTPSPAPAPDDAKKPAVGKTYKDDSRKASYTVTAYGKNVKTVTYTAPADKNVTSVKIPDAVTINGVTYQVTEIEKNAFRNCKKLKSITIGRKVKKIGKRAFYGCSSLETLIVKSTKLTAKNVGSKAWSKTSKKLIVKVPEKKYKAYKKLFAKRGLSGNVKLQKSKALKK